MTKRPKTPSQSAESKTLPEPDTFEIFRHQKSSIWLAARHTFNSALLPQIVTAPRRTVGPMTEFNPIARQSLPARLGGSGTSELHLDDETEAVISHTRAYLKNLAPRGAKHD